MKEIPLTQGKFAIIDNEDYELVSYFKWYYCIGYAAGWINKQLVYLHRLILQPPSDMQIDHINHNRLDNRRSNLRVCTHAENLRNRNIQKNNTSGFIGVCSHGKRWRAHIRLNQIYLHIGVYETKEEAAMAYDNKAVELFGEFANTNFLPILEEEGK